MDKEVKKIREEIDKMNPYEAYCEGFLDGQQDIIDAVNSKKPSQKTGGKDD